MSVIQLIQYKYFVKNIKTITGTHSIRYKYKQYLVNFTHTLAMRLSCKKEISKF